MKRPGRQSTPESPPDSAPRLADALNVLSSLRGRADDLQILNADLARREEAAVLALAGAQASVTELSRAAAEAAGVLAAAKNKRDLQIKALERSLREAATTIERLETTLAHRDQAIASALHSAEAARTERERVLTSLTWRATKPLRWLAGATLRRRGARGEG